MQVSLLQGDVCSVMQRCLYNVTVRSGSYVTDRKRGLNFPLHVTGEGREGALLAECWTDSHAEQPLLMVRPQPCWAREEIQKAEL